MHTWSHAYTHTPPSGPPGALWPALRCALKWSSGSLLPSAIVWWSCQVCRAPSQIIPRCSRPSSSSDRLTVGGCLAWFLSLSLRSSLALFLSRRISEWYWSVHALTLLLFLTQLLTFRSLCFLFFSWLVEIRSPLPRMLFFPSLLTSVSVALFSWQSLSSIYMSLPFSLSGASAWVSLEWEGLFW